MKKIVLLLVGFMATAVAHAQFEQGKVYLGASLSGLDVNYNSENKWNLGLQAKAGYLFLDNLMLTANVDYHARHELPNTLTLGVGGRYYIEQNGLFLGAGVNYVHATDHDDFMPTVQIGYAFFVSRTVTIEPELYYEESFKSHSKYATVGLRLGVGIYLFKD